jgi:hypothetical protein
VAVWVSANVATGKSKNINIKVQNKRIVRPPYLYSQIDKTDKIKYKPTPSQAAGGVYPVDTRVNIIAASCEERNRPRTDFK